MESSFCIALSFSYNHFRIRWFIQISRSCLLSMEPWTAAKKSFKLVWRYHQLLSGFLVKDHLPLSVTFVSNDKGDNEMIPGAVHRFPDIFLTAEENPGKLQLGDRLLKGQRDQSLSQMGSISSKRGR